MAMHKKLEVGAALYQFHKVTERGTNGYYNYNYGYNNQNNSSKYIISFNLIYVANRRERSSGATVPREAELALAKWGIRTQDYNSTAPYVYAVGCRLHEYHKAFSSSPFPTALDFKIAEQKFEELLIADSPLTYERIKIKKVDFIEDFKEKKIHNKDVLFTLSKSLQDFVMN